ncbi:ankyrin repeat domain-containing protein [Candidatus Kirkpatrickella diaphorinae]|uniref:Ankyrin repeat domain-containing protein n=2 Tax=Candidatus Kirkpatrickella diaphorinae TaxID=2984322 RepID=A0ABY6GL26_9PROT|nr:ankyrin repeat domain-containing protein [Candidatus Kirkpatrickella diaphorinae]
MREKDSEGHLTDEQIAALFLDAAREGDLNTIKQFIDAGMEIDAADSRGHTALIVATYKNRYDAAALLLHHGARVDAEDRKGATALSGVAFKGHERVARLLLEHGAKIDHQNHLGRTPLMFALMFERHDIVKLLLEHGADLDLKDVDGVCARDLAHSRAELTRIDGRDSRSGTHRT